MSARDDNSDETLRRELLAMIKQMGQIIVPDVMYEEARALLPEVADKIVKAEMLRRY